MPKSPYRKRMKLGNGVGLQFIPQCYNFSDLEIEGEDGEMSFDPTDDGACEENLYDDQIYNTLLIQILYNLTDREKLIFLYQLLRDQGYAIDHESFAKTLKIKRTWYMTLLAGVRRKTAFIIRHEQTNTHEKT
jgi:hypothetical protein